MREVGNSNDLIGPPGPFLATTLDEMRTTLARAFGQATLRCPGDVECWAGAATPAEPSLYISFEASTDDCWGPSQVTAIRVDSHTVEIDVVMISECGYGGGTAQNSHYDLDTVPRRDLVGTGPLTVVVRTNEPGRPVDDLTELGRTTIDRGAGW